MRNTKIPPPPPGFELVQDENIPAPPPGFELVGDQPVSPKKKVPSEPVSSPGSEPSANGLETSQPPVEEAIRLTQAASEADPSIFSGPEKLTEYKNVLVNNKGYSPDEADLIINEGIVNPQGRVKILTEKTKQQFDNNPIFKNATNRKVYFDTLKNEGYSDFQISAIKSNLGITENPQAKAYEDDFTQIVKNAIDRGLAQGQTANLLTATGDNPEGVDIEQLAQAQKDMQASKTSEDYAKFNNAKGFKEAMSALTDSPSAFANIVTELTTESTAAIIRHGLTRMAVGAGVGAAIGSVVPGAGTAAGAGYGALAGLGSSSLNLEYSGKMLETFSEMGIDTTDPEQLKDAFTNPEMVAKARDLALKKGVPIAIFDMISGGIGGALITKPAKGILKKAAAGAGEMGIQMGLGGAGELSGQVIAGEEISVPAIMGEMIGEIGSGSAEIIGGAAFRKLKQNPKSSIAAAVGSIPPGTDKKAEVIEQINFSVASGDITSQEAEQLMPLVDEAVAVDAQIPVQVDGAARAQALPVLMEKKELEAQVQQMESQKETTDPAFHSVIDEEIKVVSDQIKEKDAAIQAIVMPEPVKPETESVTMEWSGEDVKPTAVQDPKESDVPKAPEAITYTAVTDQKELDEIDQYGEIPDGEADVNYAIENGWRVYATNEQDETPSLVNSITVLENHPLDRIIILNPDLIEQEVEVKELEEAPESVDVESKISDDNDETPKTGIFLNKSAHEFVGSGLGIFGKGLKHFLPEFITRQKGSEKNFKEDDRYIELTELQVENIYENLVDDLRDSHKYNVPKVLLSKLRGIKMFLSEVGTESAKRFEFIVDEVLNNAENFEQTHDKLRKDFTETTVGTPEAKEALRNLMDSEQTFKDLDLSKLKGNLYTSNSTLLPLPKPTPNEKVNQKGRQEGLLAEEAAEKKQEDEAVTPDATPVSEVPATSKETATPSKKSTRPSGKNRNWKSPNGKYLVSFKNNGYTVTEIATGQKVTPSVRGQIMRQFKKDFDYNEGKIASEVTDISGLSEDDYIHEVASSSENPAEIALAMVGQPEFVKEYELDPIELAIAENIGAGTVIPESLKTITNLPHEQGIGHYFAKKKYGVYDKRKSHNISDIAMNASSVLNQTEELDVDSVSEQDVFDFMMKYPKGVDSFWKQRNNTYIDLNNRFIEVTGFSANPKVLKFIAENEIREQAIRNYEAKYGITPALEAEVYEAELESLYQAELAEQAEQVKAAEPTTKEKAFKKIDEIAASFKDIFGIDLPEGTQKLGGPISDKQLFDFAVAGIKYAVGKGIDIAEAIAKAVKFLNDNGYTTDIDEKELRQQLKDSVQKEHKFAKRIKPLLDADFLARFSPEAFKYNVISNKESIKKANEVIDEFGEEVSLRMAEDFNNDLDGGARNIIFQLIIRRMEERGDLDSAVAITERLFEEGEQAGRFVQAHRVLAMLGTAGQLRAAERIVEKARKKRASKRSAKKKIEKFGNDLTQAQKEAASEAVESVVVKKATEKTGEIKPKGPRRPKEYGASNKLVTKEKYQDAIKKAKGNFYSNPVNPEILTAAVYHLEASSRKFADFADRMIEDFGNKAIPVLRKYYDASKKQLVDSELYSESEFSSEKEINKVIDQKAATTVDKDLKAGIKSMDQTIAKIAKEHLTSREKTLQSLKDKLIEQAGLDPADATQLSQAIEDEFNRLVIEKQKAILDNTFSKKKQKAINQKAKSKGKKTIEQQLIELSNMGAFTDDQIMKIWAEANGYPELTDENRKEIVRLGKIVQQNENSQIKQFRALEDLLKYQSKIKGLAWHEIPMGLWYANILSGPLTQMVNFVSTFANALASFGVGVLRHKGGGVTMAKGFARGFMRSGLREALSVLQTGYSPIRGQVEMPAVLERVDFKGGMFNPANWAKFVRRFMVASDVLIFEGAKEMRAAQLARVMAKENGVPTDKQKNEALAILNETDVAWQDANEQAQKEYEADVIEINKQETTQKEKDRQLKLARKEQARRVYEIIHQTRPSELTEESLDFARRLTYNFKPEGKLGTIAKLINQFKQKYPWANLIFPFTNIIANVANETINYTPYGYWRSVLNGDGKMTDHQRADTLYKANYGMLMALAVIALTQLEDDDGEPMLEITGMGTADYKKNFLLKNPKGDGWQQYSFRYKLPNGEYSPWISYQYSPLLVMFGAIGNYMDYTKYRSENESQEDTGTRLAASLLTTSRAFFDATVLSTVNDMMNIMFGSQASTSGADVVENASRWVKNVAKSFVVPNFYNQMAREAGRMFEIQIKDVRNTIVGHLLQDIPVARNQYMDRINVLGQFIYPDTDKFISSDTDDPYVDFFVKNKVFPSEPNRNRHTFPEVDKNGEIKETFTTDQEWYVFCKTRGNYIKEQIDWFIENNEPMTKEVMQDITTEATDHAKGAVENMRYQ